MSDQVIEQVRPAQQAREMLGAVLGQIQDIREAQLDVQEVTASIAKAVGALFQALKAPPQDPVHAAEVGRAMDHLRRTLALLQDVRSDAPAIANATATIARTLALLFPISRVAQHPSRAAEVRAPEPAPARSGQRPAQRRLAPRTAIDAEIGLQSETHFFTGFSEDVSTGGIFIATYELQPIGSRINVNFTLPDGQLVSVDGEVRWVREHSPLHKDLSPGMGVRFLNLKAADQAGIQRFLKMRPAMFYVE